MGIWPSLLAYVKELISTSPIPLHFYLTGHSLGRIPHLLFLIPIGGALAILTAFELSYEIEDIRLTMYNFGSPRVGTHTFAKQYDQQVPNRFGAVYSI